MTIVVDANEARCGLADILAKDWARVEVRRLDSGDVAVGSRVLIERKTVADYVASLADGRLFRQAKKLAASVPRPIVILEDDSSVFSGRIDPGRLRGVQLALAVGFRIPVLPTRNLADTASCIRHIAAQEARRETRRRQATARRVEPGQDHEPTQLSQEAFEVLLKLPGVGRERALAIAERVESLSELCGLGVRGLMAVPGVGPDTAARIVDTLRGEGTIRARGDLRQESD